MPSTRDIRRRIKSVKNTAQITKAMQMVASSKMRKAQLAAQAGRPYAELMNTMLVSLRDRVDSSTHPLLETREVKNELVLLISTDKGLCGALNTNLFREVMHLDANTTSFVASGRKGVQLLARLKRNMLADFALPDSPTFLQSKSMSKFILEKFLDKEVDKVSVLYSRFESTLVQAPVKVQVLPIAPEAVAGDRELLETEKADSLAEYIFEPDPTHVLDALLPYYVHFQVYQMMLNARASEHSARMVAMKNATDNAKSLVKDLTLEYNKIRQAGITSELLEITTAQMALQ
jgi:F-type H+-transporting ATPase subunit gamma